MTTDTKGFPSGSAVNTGSIPGLRRSSQRRKRLPTPVFWAGEFHGLYSPWGGTESDTTELHTVIKPPQILQGMGKESGVRSLPAMQETQVQFLR